MQQFAYIVGSIVAASGTVPYIIATAKGQTKPRVVTWLTWALLTALASAAAFSDHQFGAGLFALLGSLSTAAIVVAGLRFGDRSFEKLDIACMSGVGIGLVLWLLLDNPAIGVWVAISIDCIGLVPTVKHAWQRAHEETWITYALVGVGGMLVVLPLVMRGDISVTSIGYPLYAAVSLGSLALLIIFRKRALPDPVHTEADA